MIKICLSYEECISYVRENTVYPIGENDWVIFDMDDTLVTDRHYTNVSNPFAFMYKGIHKGIDPMIELYNWCVKIGYKVCIVTGRNKSLHDISIQNLNNVGILHCDMFITKDSKERVDVWKTRCRKELGGNIIFNIGDKESDLIGGYSIHSLQIPSK